MVSEKLIEEILDLIETEIRMENEYYYDSKKYRPILKDKLLDILYKYGELEE